MGLTQALLAFRRGRYFRVFYLVVLSLMVSSMLVFFCFGLILIPLMMIALPWWLKDRKVRVLAVNGIVVMVLASIFFAAILSQNLTSRVREPLEVSALGVSLTNGTVTPESGSPGATYSFTVDLKVGSGGVPASFPVYLNLSRSSALSFAAESFPMAPYDPANTNLSGGVRYVHNRTVDDGVYFYWFSVGAQNATGMSWLATGAELGPVVAGYGSFFAFSLGFSVQYMILPIIFYYMFVFLMWFTRRSRAARGQRVETAGESGFMCTNCGSDVPADANRCPKCGAEFEASGPAPKGEGADAKR